MFKSYLIGIALILLLLIILVASYATNGSQSIVPITETSDEN